MEHLYKFLNRKRIDAREVLATVPVEVSLKIDGQALQVANENGVLTYHKRSGVPYRVGPELTYADFYLFRNFYTAYNYLEKFRGLLNSFMTSNRIYILNFELFDDSNGITVKYKRLPKSKMILLNGTRQDGTQIDEEELSSLAHKLQVSTVPIFFKGILGEEKASKIIEICHRYCNPMEPHLVKGASFSSLVLDVINPDAKSEPLLDTENGDIEGFVFNIKTSTKTYSCKLDDPNFILKHKADNKEQLEKDEKANVALDNIANLIRDNIDVETLHKMTVDKIKNLAMNFSNQFEDKPEVIDEIYNEYEKVKDEFSFMTYDSALLPKDYNNTSKKWKIALMFFIIFMKSKRKNDVHQFNSLIDRIDN